MRITQEADYAIRIISRLASSESVCGAADIAAQTGVPPRFTHKILRKLLQGGFVQSFSGAHGGYMLNRTPSAITMLDIIEFIDGPFALSKCADEAYLCSKNGNCKEDCVYHCVLAAITKAAANRLSRFSIADLISPRCDISALIEQLQ